MVTTSPVKTLHNKYSVLYIEETDDVEDNDSHTKRVEITSKPISPTKILKQGEKLSKEVPTRVAIRKTLKSWLFLIIVLRKYSVLHEMYSCRLSKTKWLQGRYSRRDTTSLEWLEMLRSKVEWYEGLKPNAQGLKNTLDCVEQEWRLKYRQLATYTMGRVSIEHHRTREN